MMIKKQAKNERSNFHLYCTTIAVNIYSFASGIAYSWTSPAIPKLNGSIEPELNPLSAHPLTKEEESWLAALLSLGSAMGPLVFGQLSNKIGCRKTLILASIPFALSYIILAYSNHVYLLYLGRLICGFGTGAGFTLVPIYVGEISNDEIRGKLGCLMPFILSLGLLFSYVTGPFLTLKLFSLINILPPILFLILALIYLPESPYFLLKNNRIDEAKNCLEKLRGTKLNIQTEIDEIKINLNAIVNEKGGFKDLLLIKKRLYLTMGCMAFQQLSGITPVLSYMQTMFDEAGSSSSSSISSEISVIIVGFIVCFASAITSLTVDKLGRKFLLLFSLFLAGSSQLTLGIYFVYLRTKESFFWLPIFCLILFMVAYYLGLGNIPWVLNGELFPSNVKATASSISTFVCLIVAFLITVIYPYMSIYVGTGESFILFAVFCAFGFLFVLILLPETKGKSLYDIQMLFNK